jgi:hypothetical protein
MRHTVPASKNQDVFVEIIAKKKGCIIPDYERLHEAVKQALDSPDHP